MTKIFEQSLDSTHLAYKVGNTAALKNTEQCKQTNNNNLADS